MAEAAQVQWEQKEFDHLAKFRQWCWTLFNYDEVIIEHLKKQKHQYICFQEEVCPSTGRKHLQGFSVLPAAKTLSAMCKNYFMKPYHPNLAPRYRESTDACAALYCLKNESRLPGGIRFSDGELGPGQGKRTDLNALKELIMTGQKTPAEIMEENPMAYHQYGRTMEALHSVALSRKFRTWMSTCTWLVGPPGVGKSHLAFEGYNPETHYRLLFDKHGLKFQCNYKGQETIIINEFRGQIPYSVMLEMIDKWPFDFDRKCKTSVPCLAKHFIVTSPMTPEECYHRQNEKDSIVQLLERVDVQYIGGPSRRVLAGKRPEGDRPSTFAGDCTKVVRGNNGALTTGEKDPDEEMGLRAALLRMKK